MPDEDRCDARNDRGYTCEKSEGHTGPHAAFIDTNLHPRMEWEND